MKIASSWGLSPDSHSVYLSTRLLAVSAQYAAKGSRNGTVSVRLSACLSQYGPMHSSKSAVAGLLL